MQKKPLGRRQFLRKLTQSLGGLGVAAAGLDSLDHLFPARVVAADLPPGTAYQATGFYERTSIGRETLVAVVLVPLNGTAPPMIQDGTGLERRDLGSAPLATFQGRVGGMRQKLLFDHGALRAVVYSLNTVDGDYAEEKRYLVGRSELDIENPRTRAQMAEGGGGHGGSSGDGAGGGGM